MDWIRWAFIAFFFVAFIYGHFHARSLREKGDHAGATYWQLEKISVLMILMALVK